MSGDKHEACGCTTGRAFYRDGAGSTREASGGYKLRCAAHVAAGRAADKWARAWLAKWYPRTALALPAPAFEECRP